VAGIATTFFRAWRATAAFTNMPGWSFSPGFATVACSWTFRVSASTRGFTVVMSPSTVRPGDRVARKPHRKAFPQPGQFLLGQGEVDEDRVERLQRNDRVSLPENLAEVHLPDAQAAAERRVGSFFWRWWRGGSSRWAIACLFPATEASYSAWEMIFSASIRVFRSRTTCVNVT